MDERGTTLTERISFAEDWLGRARLQIESGRADRGALALLFAEAELHRAREAGLAVPEASSGPRTGRLTAWAAFGALGAAAAVLAFTVAVARPLASVDAHAPAQDVIRLSAATGDMLRIVTALEPAVERTVIQSRIVHVPVAAPAVPVRRPAALSPTGALQPATPPRVVAPAAPARVAPAPQVAAVPAPPAPPVTPVVLSDAEVIEMVLAAERSLRRTGSQ
jgi:hypothetical protein